MKDMLNTYNLYVTCLGEGFAAGYQQSIQQACEACDQEPVPTSILEELSGLLAKGPLVARRRRQAEFTDEKRAELLTAVTEHKMEMLEKLGNFSCVLMKMGIFTEEGEVNMEQFSFDAAKEFLKDSNIGEDDDALKAVTDSYADCNAIATEWPESTLEKNPLAKAFGRRHVFLKCMLKVQDEMCYKKQMYDGLKMFAGLDTAEVELGIPGDKYDQAAGVWGVMREESSKSMRMINDFFWTRM